VEERERMETVPMGNGSKEELFEKGHPVIRELKSIPEIIFEEQIGMLPSSAIPVKSLFARKQMDHFHVDSLILKKIALQVLHILKKLSQKHIYPGLIELQEFYVDMDNSQYGVVLLHPEKFQLLTFEQDYEWYPEDERIFGDATLFDEKMQQIADNRLIYKILVASARGNVKIPPLKTEADYSELFYNILSEEWKQIFENRAICSYEKLQNLLEESIQMEEEFARMTKESIDEKSEQNKTKKAEELQARKSGETSAEQFDLFIILRTELDNSKKISKMLYLLQDELELENTLSGYNCQQAFVFGNGAVQVKTFQNYRTGFRCQFPQTIREYSSGEALIIGTDLMKEKKEELLLKNGENHKQQLCLYILMDGRIKNDQLFQIALNRLQKLKEEGVKLCLRMVDNIYCEACQKLKDIVEDTQRCC
jgi:hypothetical protein